MTVPRQKLVEQAIRFASPERVPIVFWNRDQEQGDIMFYQLADLHLRGRGRRVRRNGPIRAANYRG